MKKFTRFFIATMIIAMMAACSSSLSYEQASKKNRKNIDNFDRLADSQFLVEAQSFSLLEKDINALAKEKGYSSEVVRFADSNLKLNQKKQKELTRLARKEKMKIPGELKAEHRRWVSDLTSVARADFDKKFIEILTNINKESTKLYEDKSTTAYDPDVRAFAARYLGEFRNHLNDLSKVDEHLLRTSN